MRTEHLVPEPSTQHRPLCTICIANYNGADTIGKCLDSVLNQDFEHAIEIIVHDDASADNSVSYIQHQYPQVYLLRSTENVGFCISNNRMVAQAKGEYILLLNNDAFLHKDALKTLHSAAENFGYGIYGLPQYDAGTGGLIDRGSLLDLFFNPVPNKNRNLIDVAMIIGACLWLPRSMWFELGGFPEWFGSMAEDMYLCSVARLWGYPVKALPESGFAHQVGASFGGGKVLQDNSLATTIKRRALSERNKTSVMIISCPSPAAYAIIPLHLIVLCLEGLLLSLVKLQAPLFKEIYWQCLINIWRERKKLKKHRKAVQARRQCSYAEYFASFVLIPYKLKMLLKHGLPTISG